MVSQGSPNYSVEPHNYDELLELTRQTTLAGVTTAADLECVFPSTANNGRILSRIDHSTCCATNGPLGGRKR